MTQASGKSFKHPILFSLLLTLIMLVFPILSGTIATIFGLSELEGRLVQSIAFLLAAALGCLIALRRFGSLHSVGLRQAERLNLRQFLGFTPLVLAAALPLIIGLKDDLSVQLIALNLVFTFLVGFTEELYFRGLIWNSLRQKSTIFAFVLSSILFSLGHFFNLMAGASLIQTILQVVFAFFFGLVAVAISHATQSILIPILWHFLHNFISLTARPADGQAALAVALAQGTILVLYAIYLYVRFLQKERTQP